MTDLKKEKKFYYVEVRCDNCRKFLKIKLEKGINLISIEDFWGYLKIPCKYCGTKRLERLKF